MKWFIWMLLRRVPFWSDAEVCELHDRIARLSQKNGQLQRTVITLEDRILDLEYSLQEHNDRQDSVDDSA